MRNKKLDHYYHHTNNNSHATHKINQKNAKFISILTEAKKKLLTQTKLELQEDLWPTIANAHWQVTKQKATALHCWVMKDIERQLELFIMSKVNLIVIPWIETTWEPKKIMLVELELKMMNGDLLLTKYLILHIGHTFKSEIQLWKKRKFEKTKRIKNKR